MSAIDIVRRYLDAFASGDPDLIAGCVTDDFANEHTSELGTGTSGRVVYRERLPGFLAQFQDLRYQVLDELVDGGRVVVRYLLSAVCDGSAISIPGVMWFETRDGAISRRVDVWDSLTFLRQIGAVTDVPR